jgi:hypothetical protein
MVFYVESAGFINCLPSMIPAHPPLPPSDQLFDILQRHARMQPDAIACASRFRHASYRKLWSRIERATARLQGEWHVKAGDVVAYCGHGHPDALVLYVALARCGAMLLPLEHGAADDAHAASAAVLALFDDEIAPPRIALAAHPLSRLIGERCAYQARVTAPDPSACSLLRIASDGSLQGHSLTQMSGAPASGAGEVHGALFDAGVFEQLVLPTLIGGATLTWA